MGRGNRALLLKDLHCIEVVRTLGIIILFGLTLSHTHVIFILQGIQMRRSSKMWFALFLSSFIIVVAQVGGYDKREKQLLKMDATAALQNHIAGSVKLKKLAATLTYIYDVVKERVSENGVQEISKLQDQWLAERMIACNRKDPLAHKENCLSTLYQARIDTFYMFYEINR